MNKYFYTYINMYNYIHIYIYILILIHTHTYMQSGDFSNGNRTFILTRTYIKTRHSYIYTLIHTCRVAISVTKIGAWVLPLERQQVDLKKTFSRRCNTCVLQCVAVCCRVLQCVAVCCSVLQCVAVCCSVLQCVAVRSLCASVEHQ